MSFENLNWHNESILEEVIKNQAVENIDTTIITTAGKEGILL